MRKIKGFAYDDIGDTDIIEHLKKQQNLSKYIRDLIRSDMSSNSIEMIVQKQIEKYLSNVEIKPQLKEDKISTSVISDILNMWKLHPVEKGVLTPNHWSLLRRLRLLCFT